MKNIINIIRHDLKKISSSAVAMITIMGLCVIPCLYAWFNIFSNWDPYSSDATGRIAVAVANEDEGAEMLGLKVNIGDTVISSLKANEDIGWVFVDSEEEALEGVYASDYYAALIIPKDFSTDMMSFISGDLDNPKMIYYENEKKNAIAPKITGKAKTAVVEQVNSTFISTIAKYVSEAAKIADENGLNPQDVLSDLSSRLSSMSSGLDSSVVMLEAITGLTDSTQTLLKATDNFVGNIQDTIDAQQGILNQTSDAINSAGNNTTTNVSDIIAADTEIINAALTDIQSDLDTAFTNLDKYNEFISKDLAAKQALVESLKSDAEEKATYLEDLGLTGLASQYSNLAQRLTNLSDRLATLQEADASQWEETLKVYDSLSSIISGAQDLTERIGNDINTSVDNAVNKAVSSAQASIASLNSALESSYGKMNNLSDTLNNYNKTLSKLDGGLEETLRALISLQGGLNTLAGVFDKIADSNALNNVNGIFTDDSDAIADYLGSPVSMDTEVVYPIREYGSAMAPFYTVLAQWIGSLLTAVLIKTKVKERDDLKKLRIHQRFFGRYGLYLLVGLVTAIVVSLGDLFYVDIYCPYKAQFVLAALVNGVVFTMINFALVFALDNIGMAAAVILLVLQVGGAGGTYPVEVLPSIFQKMYPFMPFKYAMDAMRECVGGMYANDYAWNLGMLGIFFVGAIVFGILLYKPALWLNRLIAESKAKSDVML